MKTCFEPVRLRPVLFLPALLLAGAASLGAQIAPRPVQLAAAKTVFLSNAVNAFDSANVDPYNVFYADVQALNRFAVVLSPAEADLVLELDGGGDHFTLRILDPKSNVVLWTVSEVLQPAARTATALKNLHTSLLNLAGDLKQVCLSTQ